MGVNIVAAVFSNAKVEGSCKVAIKARIKRFIQLCSPVLDGAQSPVTAVTVWRFNFGDTSIVNMVRRASTKALFELGDTRQQWKGEAAASFV
jgi:hypothetical protein